MRAESWVPGRAGAEVSKSCIFIPAPALLLTLRSAHVLCLCLCLCCPSSFLLSSPSLSLPPFLFLSSSSGGRESRVFCSGDVWEIYVLPLAGVVLSFYARTEEARTRLRGTGGERVCWSRRRAEGGIFPGERGTSGGVPYPSSFLLPARARVLAFAVPVLPFLSHPPSFLFLSLLP
ncbi:hypothetical protein B0H13DRAFT_149832 [Mycena leptocephala]|nr:hypothetical protein B0H13DRAFT_149832 [Mycena leptocephala]